MGCRCFRGAVSRSNSRQIGPVIYRPRGHTPFARGNYLTSLKSISTHFQHFIIIIQNVLYQKIKMKSLRGWVLKGGGEQAFVGFGLPPPFIFIQKTVKK